MVNCVSSKEVMRVPAIPVETADRAETAQIASAFFVSAERAIEEIIVRQSPILVDRILACTVVCAWERNLGTLILQLHIYIIIIF